MQPFVLCPLPLAAAEDAAADGSGILSASIWSNTSCISCNKRLCTCATWKPTAEHCTSGSDHSSARQSVKLQCHCPSKDWACSEEHLHCAAAAAHLCLPR
jgi:hypothetical protein